MGVVYCAPVVLLTHDLLKASLLPAVFRATLPGVSHSAAAANQKTTLIKWQTLSKMTRASLREWFIMPVHFPVDGLAEKVKDLAHFEGVVYYVCSLPLHIMNLYVIVTAMDSGAITSTVTLPNAPSCMLAATNVLVTCGDFLSDALHAPAFR